MGLSEPDGSLTEKVDDENGLLSQRGCPLSTSGGSPFIGWRAVELLPEGSELQML